MAVPPPPTQLALVSDSFSIREWPPSERPRERLRNVGSAALSARELLAILVGSGGGGHSAIDVAGALLGLAEGSLRRLGSLSPPDLERLGGVGPAIAARVAAALEMGRRMAGEPPAERPRIRGPADVHLHCRASMRDLTQEEFRVLLLNTQHAVVREVTVTRGVLDASVVHPREVFRAAISESAAALILVHNHPSGDPTPSAEDREVTEQLAAAGRIVGIPVLDHIVIGDGHYASFSEAGWLQA